MVFRILCQCQTWSKAALWCHLCACSGRGVPGEGQYPAACQPALHPDGLLPGQGLQHPDPAAEPDVPAGNRTQISGGEQESHRVRRLSRWRLNVQINRCSYTCDLQGAAHQHVLTVFFVSSPFLQLVRSSPITPILLCSSLMLKTGALDNRTSVCCLTRLHTIWLGRNGRRDGTGSKPN